MFGQKILCCRSETVFLRRTQCCGSEMFIPDPNFFHPGYKDLAKMSRIRPKPDPQHCNTSAFPAFSLFQAFHLLLPGAGGHTPLQKWINRWILLPFSTYVTTMSLSPFFLSSSSYRVNRLMIGPPPFQQLFFLKVFSWRFRRKNTKEPELLCKMLPLLLPWLVRSHFVLLPANCLDFWTWKSIKYHTCIHPRYC